MFVINEARTVTWIMSRKLSPHPLEITFRVGRHGGRGEWIRSFRKHWLDLVFLNHHDISVTHDKEHKPDVKSREKKKVLVVKWFISSTLQNKSRSFAKILIIFLAILNVVLYGWKTMTFTIVMKGLSHVWK